MGKPFLGVQILARDVEATLLRCLESTRRVADEWIVVDTGSRDRTVELARAFGAEVVQVPWEDDFSKARNAGLARARAEWVLCIDADEELTDADPAWLDVLRNTDADSFWMVIENVLGPESTDRLFHRALRLFRRRPGVAFRGRIHEEVAPSTPRSPENRGLQTCPWRIVHCGYRPEVLLHRDKARRNLHLLRLALRDRPQDPFYLYQIGVTWCQLGRLDKAARWMTRAVTLTPPGAPYRPTLFRDLGMVWLALGRFREIELTLRPELERYPDYADLHVIFADALRAQGFWEEAVDAYLRAASCPPSDQYVHSIGTNSFRPLHAAAELYLEMERWEEAERLARRAVAASPGWEPALLTLAEILVARGLADSDIVIELAPFAGKPPDRRLLVRTLAYIGADQAALDLLERNGGQPGEEEERTLRIRCLMGTGRYGEACREMEVRFHQDNPGSSRPTEEVMDFALARWAEDLPLPHRFYSHLDDRLRPVYDGLDRWMAGDIRAISKMANVIGPGRDVVCALIERAVHLHLLPTAERLTTLPWGPFGLTLAKALYREGFVYPAADRMLDLLARRELDAEGIYLLGELLYDKGHWDRAAELFEQSLALGFPHARAAAAAAAIQSAREMLEEAAAQHPEPGRFAEERDALEKAVRLLNGLGWHTRWRGRGRRNRRESTADLPLYDRQK
ncbi:MAG: glycosyltransferase [Kyrpidia sp.]|nr:glycosyltransferase [Kyrpidia sp.]